MKKIKILVFFIICIFSLSSVKAAMKCDIDGNNLLTEDDMLLLRDMVGMDETPNENTTKFAIADCNSDGIINTVDITTLKILVEKAKNKVSCGNVTDIPKIMPKLTSLAITIVQIAVPVILVLMGSLDLFKGITAGKEDEMKKGQQMFIKRLIVGAVIFFIVVIVKFLVSVVADTNVNNIVDCIDCFVSNDC